MAPPATSPRLYLALDGLRQALAGIDGDGYYYDLSGDGVVAIREDAGTAGPIPRVSISLSSSSTEHRELDNGDRCDMEVGFIAHVPYTADNTGNRTLVVLQVESDIRRAIAADPSLGLGAGVVHDCYVRAITTLSGDEAGIPATRGASIAGFVSMGVYRGAADP